MPNNNIHFETKVNGKWILAGEHTVLRGGRAIVFPLSSKYLSLSYTNNELEFEISLGEKNTAELELIIWSVLEKALKKLGIKRTHLKGHLKFESKIQFGAGMGASATLCVALTHFFHHLGFLSESDKYEFARDLENIFHGESSGVDVAVALYNKPLLFSRNDGFSIIENYQKPLLYLSYTGVRGVTKECVEKVKNLVLSNKIQADLIDEKMKSSVLQLFELIKSTELNDQAWITQLKNTHECFRSWGLVNDAVRAHEIALYDAGASAVKLTGSGNGGFMLSYWLQKPPANVTIELIPCFNN